jgi:hypothetical protein
LSSEEVALVLGAAALGAAAGSVAIYLYSKRSSKSVSLSNNGSRSELDRVGGVGEGNDAEDANPSFSSSANHKIMGKIVGGESGQRLIPKLELERSKRELKTLQLERELVSSAITRLYEAEAAREITREEREILSEKYRGELLAIDEKIQKIGALVEIGDLEMLRDQLLRLVTQKIEAIDKRLERTKALVEPLLADLSKKNRQEIGMERTETKAIEIKQPHVPDISDLIKSPGQQKVDQTPRGEGDVASLPQDSNEEHQSKVESVVSSSGSSSESEITVEKGKLVDLESGQSNSKRSREASSRKAEELQREILEALERLEKLDVEDT